MELHKVEVAALHFPHKEWRGLRPLVHLSTVKAAPDGFLWGARVGDALWAWHPYGYAIDTEGLKADARVRVLLLNSDQSDQSELEAHALYLKTIYAASAAQDAEWVAALQVLDDRLGWNPAEKGLPKWWKEALEACGLEPHLGVLAQRQRYTFLNLTELKLVFDKRWDLSTFDLLETLSPFIRDKFVQTMIRWGLSAGHTKEALNFTLILVRKMGEKTAKTILDNPFKNVDEFRTGLFRVAQPELASLAQKRIELLRTMNLPPRCSVFGDPSFENDVIKVTHMPRKLVDFDRFKDWVNDPETADKMRELLEIYEQ